MEDESSGKPRHEAATSADQSRPVATYVARLEGENEFLRGQIGVKDKTIEALLERDRESPARAPILRLTDSIPGRRQFQLKVGDSQRPGVKKGSRSNRGHHMDRVDYQPLIIQDIINLNTRKELDLRPWYQRRVVWTPQQQSYLVNTILEQKPVPSIYIRHSIDMSSGKSIREVVDGQQRLVAILEFVADKFASRHPKYPKPVKFSLLSSKEKHQFLTTALSVGYLLGAEDSDVIEIFGRINSVSKKLLPAEKRNANFSGEFKQFSVRQASARVDFWRSHNIFTALQIARMAEMQFVSELAMNMLQGLQDYNPKKIDKFYKDNDVKFAKEAEVTKRFEAAFGLLVSLNDTTLKDTIFSRAPIFFSLFLVLDSIKNRISVEDLRSALGDMDARFESKQKTKADTDFYVACTSNPHRIRSREIRNRYIRSHVG